MKQRQFFFTVLLVLTGWAGSASAGLTTPVTVNGLEWLQPTDFVGFSVYDINTVCDAAAGGQCSGSLGGNDVTGWTWANSNDLSTLFNHYIGLNVVTPGVTYQEVNSTWAPAFFADGWRYLDTNFFSFGTILAGTTSDNLVAYVSDNPNYDRVDAAGFLFAGLDTAWFYAPTGTYVEPPFTEPVILPDVTTTTPDPVGVIPPGATAEQTFTFNDPPPGNWFDPVAADAYLYELYGGGEFLEVRGVPGYSDLQIAWGEGYASILESDLDPGESYFFGPGVTSFVLRGFNPGFDASDPNAIPTYLDFSGSPTELRMTALSMNGSSEAPVPATLPLLGLALATLGFTRRKCKLHS